MPHINLNIVCPFCQHSISEEAEIFSKKNNMYEAVCDNCEKLFFGWISGQFANSIIRAEHLRDIAFLHTSGRTMTQQMVEQVEKQHYDLLSDIEHINAIIKGD